MTSDAKTRHYDTVARAIEFIRKNAKRQPTLEDIAQAVHMSPFHLQRVFSEWAGLSPKRFLQYVTKQHAKACLSQSHSVLQVSESLGLSSASRLHDLMITSEAMTPGEIQSAGEGLRIGFGRGESPFGEALVAWTPRGICHFSFVDEDFDERVARLKVTWARATLTRDDTQALRWTTQIFARGVPRGPIHLVLRGTNFQIKVWEALIHTRPAEVMSYGRLAQKIHQPKAQRAVGTALSLNDIGFLIPCHRVIQESGEVGQFRWGTARKVAMQAWEQGIFGAPEQVPAGAMASSPTPGAH
jgi:AraC family transcriptional regulator, regulatory protein of adaptative response / methylated-DNA-[protein]-cysteine methyltransferase